ncbi:unnamed protein product [Boreogadus saida]
MTQRCDYGAYRWPAGARQRRHGLTDGRDPETIRVFPALCQAGRRSSSPALRELYRAERTTCCKAWSWTALRLGWAKPRVKSV